MKIISNELGAISRHFVTDEIRPPGGSYVPDLLKLVSERYGFTVVPTAQETLEKGAVFKNGRLISGSKRIPIPIFGVFNDGIQVTAFDTDTAEFIMEDAINWGWEALNLRKPVTTPTTVYDSQLVVEFESPVENTLKIFGALKPLIESAWQTTYGLEVKAHAVHVGLGLDPQSLPRPFTLGTRPNFAIERRIGHPYSGNRYFCAAAMRTNTHIEILEAFEKSISA